jgi:hypothetical protein
VNANDAINLLAQGVTTLIAMAAALFALWRLVLKEPVTTFRNIFTRVDSIEEDRIREKRAGQEHREFEKAAIQDGFRDLRVAFDEGQTETISRLDAINGSVARHEAQLHELDKAQAVEAAKREAEAGIIKALLTTAHVTLGHQEEPPP